MLYGYYRVSWRVGARLVAVCLRGLGGWESVRTHDNLVIYGACRSEFCSKEYRTCASSTGACQSEQMNGGVFYPCVAIDPDFFAKARKCFR